MKDLYQELRTQFKVSKYTEQRADLAFITVPRKQLRSLLLHMRGREGFTHLVLLTAVDWIESNQFQLTYLLNNRSKSIDLGLRVMIKRKDASMESIHELWPTAATYQRELREMFGIDFPGSPGINDDFILEGWNDIPPYRRDFDTLKYSLDNYHHKSGRETHDPASHMKHELYPDEK